MKIAIAAATGNIGSRVAQQVANTNHTAILLGRNAEHLQQLNIPNSIVSVTDISNAAQVIEATKGADALFWVVPPTITGNSLKEWYQQVTAAGVTAVKRNEIKKVVLISTIGAAAAENLGTVTYAGETEAAFDQLNADVLTLRPGYFLENFLLQAQSIKQQGEFYFTYGPDHDMPLITTDDIGDTAANYLLSDTWSGHWKLNLMGPENMTMSDAAKRLSTLLGKPVHYKQSLLQEAKQQFASWGASETVQQELLDLYVALGDPNGIYATPRTPEAFTPTCLEDFARKKLIPLIR